ncbi:MAG: hypothetical protein IJN13_03360 [Bacilli bacterium]|nr:hypothetical protein [Bacilli bacterium]
MIKKILFSVVLLVVPIITFASDNTSFAVGNKFYDTLEDAILNASSTDTIELFSSANLTNPLTINKVVNIDLNGNNITAPSTVFVVQGGTLNISGKGTIKENEPYNGAIRVIGKTSDTEEKYSSLNVGKDVTLEGWSGIFITHTSNKSHGVYVNFDGSINALDDKDGSNGAGLYVNGSIQHVESSPIINITDNAKITSTGTGIYIAGYSTFNIGNAYIEGNLSGIGIKSGKLNIDGATVVCNGKDSTPTEGYNNGMNASGTAIQIESNSGYAGNMVLNISSGTIKSKNSSVIYEYIGKGDSTEVKSISITGGTFTSEAGKNVFLLSNSFKDTHQNFISGGKFSSNPTDFLKSGYTANLENNYYDISKSAMAVFGTNSNSNNTFNVLTILLLIVFGIIIYFNRLKIVNVFKKLFNI